MAADRRAGPGTGPETAVHLPKGSWRRAVRRAIREFRDDNLTDLAAALTYYGILSIFPGLIVLIAVLGLAGQSTVDNVKAVINDAAPGEAGQLVINAISRVQGSPASASIATIVGLLIAFWSASGYVAAFMRASNTIYDVPEGRPIWKKLPIRLGVTAVVGIMLLIGALIVVFTGELAELTGQRLGLGSTAVTVWNIVKWPVLLILVSQMFAILYWASPNARHGGFRWASPGGLVAVVIWLVASVLFAVYLGNFASYNETYGSLAGVIVFLVWLWITNIAILLGAEVDAELERERAIVAGHPADKEPYLQLQDDRKIKRSSPERLRTRET
jgi:membrane protein